MFDTLYNAIDMLLPFQWLSHTFMKNAFIAILIITPLFGLLSTMVVSNKMSFFADSLGHGAFTGIAVGILLGGIDPMWGATLFSVCFAIAITIIKNNFIYKLFKITNGNAIIISAKVDIYIFCFKVIDLLSIKLSKYFLYILLDLNQASNLFAPLAKQYDVKSKNGTVGNIGSTVPIIPNKRDITPTITNIIFFILFIKLSYFLNMYSIYPFLVLYNI